MEAERGGMVSEETYIFSKDGLERMRQLQAILEKHNWSETLAVTEMALALETDPIAALVAAGVCFESAVIIEIADDKILVRARDEKSGEATVLMTIEITELDEADKQRPREGPLPDSGEPDLGEPTVRDETRTDILSRL